MQVKLVTAALATLLLVQCHSTRPIEAELKDQILELFPGATIEGTSFEEPYTEAYEIVIPQYLDHAQPEKGTFDHRIFLYHAGYDRPVHLETGGYDAYLAEREISKNLELNLIIVEFRFYGESMPEVVPWELLTNDQAIADYHRINQAFRKIYKKGKWLTSGISKGGETAMIYKSKYPADADVVVPYVAPIIADTMDMRPWEHVARVGTEECRNKVKDFQKLLLKQKKEVLKLVQKKAEEDSLTFAIGDEMALEYAVLEYPFSFWQWNADCEGIPTESVALDGLFAHLEEISTVKNFADQSFESGQASYYQHMRELGYYVMDTTGLSQWLSTDFYTHRIFAPKGVDLSYNPTYMKLVREYVENQGERMIWVYGGLDPWGACAVEPKGKDCFKFVKPDGTHRTRIKHLEPAQQQQIYDSLRSWLEI